MSKAIGILAHVDTGKTTLSEQLLYHAGVIRRAGRVDHKDAALDLDPMERERGITIFSDQAHFSYKGEKYYWLDTPGHVDFSAEAERVLGVLDMAILLVSAVEGVQSHTRTLWRLLAAHELPVMIFVNKADRVGADLGGVTEQLREKLGANVLPLNLPFDINSLDEEAIELIAEGDERLMEAYFEGGFEPDRWLESLRRQIRSRAIFPVFHGSALRDEGVKEFLDVMSLLAPSYAAPASDEFSARVYKIRHDGPTRLTFFKVLSGSVNARDAIDVPDDDAPGGVSRQKITELRLYDAARCLAVPRVEAGDLCAAVGLDGGLPGDIIGCGAMRGRGGQLEPILSAAALPDSTHTGAQLHSALRVLEQEEPTLRVSWDNLHKRSNIALMGAIELDVLHEQLASRFGIDVQFTPCEVMYTETIAAPVIGIGHYEPLRHYAEVVLRLEPAPRGAGISFDSELHVDKLSLQYQNLIRTHVFERVHRGVLTGSPLTDVRVVLIDGRAHLKHTEGGDFREATYRAIRQALMRAESVLLEPVCRFEIGMPLDMLGKVSSDLSRLQADIGAPMQSGSECTITGEMPISSMLTYAADFSMQMRGKGHLTYAPDHSEPCRDAQSVIACKQYDPLSDPDQPPTSVFCAHGAGFVVAWYKANEWAHCEAAHVYEGQS